MADKYRIASRFDEDIEYTFDDMLLDEQDENVESDIHIIEIFGLPYSIAMGKLNISEGDKTLGYFISYLLYEKKVVRKLGIYETNTSIDVMTINHRSFDFEKIKISLFDEYYEDNEILNPYMYKNDDVLPEKTIIKLKQGNVEFEENIEKQSQFIEQIQERVEKYKPEKTQHVIGMYYKYISYTSTLLHPGPEKRKMQTNIKSPKLDYFKTDITDKGPKINSEKSQLFENMMKTDITLGSFELIVLEILANVKIIIIENGDFMFNFLKYKEDADFSKMNKVGLYSEFDPKDVLFIHKSVNADEESFAHVLLYKGNVINSFDNLDDGLSKIISQKLNDDQREAEHPTRFKHLKTIKIGVDEVDTEVVTEVDTEVDTVVDTEVDTEVDTVVDTEVDTVVDTEVDTEVDTDKEEPTKFAPLDKEQVEKAATELMDDYGEKLSSVSVPIFRTELGKIIGENNTEKWKKEIQKLQVKRVKDNRKILPSKINLDNIKGTPRLKLTK